MKSKQSIISPLVSVCIPTYNGEEYLGEALESVKCQTYRPLELICSDDKSTDCTKKILEKFKEKSDFPVYIIDHRPSGIGANWNNCIKNAKGEYIKFLFQDDVLEPLCIERLLNCLRGNEEIGLVACKRHIISDKIAKDEEIEQWIEEYGDLQRRFAEEGKMTLDISFFRSNDFMKNPLNKVAEPSGILLKKNIFSQVGLFREDIIQILDVEFYNRILKKYKILLIPEKLYSFRIHEKQTTIQNSGKDERDFHIYNHLLIKNYFWLLNPSARLTLLDKNYPLLAKAYRFAQRSLSLRFLFK